MDTASLVSAAQAIQSSLSVLTALQLTSYKYPPAASYDRDLTFDYVVVGAGTAGSVLAARLSEDPDVTVALIEAGGDPPIEAIVPGIFTLEPRTSYDYDFHAENDNYTCQHALDKIAHIPAGKLLGGTSNLIHMPYIRGSPEDFDYWCELTGDDTWNYDNLFPYFIKIERMEDPAILNSNTANLHGTKGPLGLTREPHDINANYIKAMQELGFEYNLDVTENPFGVTDSMLLNSNRVKQGTAEGYLSPAKDRKNLFVYKNTVVTKILFDDDKNAIGVEALSSDNRTISFNADQEVIVSAGAIRSPQLLMLSGIGPGDHLSDFNIPVISDLPVGKNLRDRSAVTFAYRMQASNATIPPTDPYKFPVPFTLGLKAFDDSQPVPDFQILNIVFPHDQLSGLAQVSAISLTYENAVTDRFLQANTGHDLYMGVVNSKYPISTGELLLRSLDPLDQPQIDLGLLSQPSDVEDLGSYLYFMSQIAQTSFFKNVGAEFVELDLPECAGLDRGSLEFWKCYAVAMSVPFWQTMSTCSMGPVVSSDLRVKGVQSLRVVDISVQPYFDSGEPLPTVVVIAEKAADMIKQSRV